MENRDQKNHSNGREEIQGPAGRGNGDVPLEGKIRRGGLV